jgi:hypothetical protein
MGKVPFLAPTARRLPFRSNASRLRAWQSPGPHAGPTLSAWRGSRGPHGKDWSGGGRTFKPRLAGGRTGAPCPGKRAEFAEEPQPASEIPSCK